MNDLFHYNNFKRFLARYLDYAIYLLLMLQFSNFINIKILNYFLIPIGLLFAVFIESLFLYYFKTTIGKFVFGIYLDKQYSYFELIKRSLRVYVYGMAMGITVLIPVMNLIAYVKSIKNNQNFWDSKTGTNIIYKNINIFIRLILFWIIMMILLFVAGVILKKELGKYNIQNLKLPIKEIVVDYPDINTDIDVAEWIKICQDGGMTFSVNNNYDYNKEYLLMFCEQAASNDDSINETLGDSPSMKACIMGFSYEYSQKNGASPDLIIKNIEEFEKLRNDACKKYLNIKQEDSSNE